MRDIISNDQSLQRDLSVVCLPPKIETDINDRNRRKFLLCDKNLYRGSYRSPWTNTYHPPLGNGDKGSKSSARNQQLELIFNECFDVYRKQYYGSNDDSVSSVYVTEHGVDPASFQALFLIRKDLGEGEQCGQWCSFHDVIYSSEKGDKTYAYDLCSTILLSTGVDSDLLGKTNVSGYLTRHNRESFAASSGSPHIVRIGEMIESIETELVAEMDSLHIHRTRELLTSVRHHSADDTQGGLHVQMLNQAILQRKKVPGISSEENPVDLDQVLKTRCNLRDASVSNESLQKSKYRPPTGMHTNTQAALMNEAILKRKKMMNRDMGQQLMKEALQSKVGKKRQE